MISIDLYFLNRAIVKGVTSSSQLVDVFKNGPAGLTPTSNVLRQVLTANAANIAERKLLIIILTDGQPTNASGTVDTETLKHVLMNERKADRVYVSIVACTDDSSTMVSERSVLTKDERCICASIARCTMNDSDDRDDGLSVMIIVVATIRP